MKSKRWFKSLLMLTLLLAACAPATEGTPTPANILPVPETGSTATATMAATELPATEAATETQTSTETPTLVAGPDVIVMVSQEGEAGPHLVDDQGRSLYVFLNDEKNSNTSVCLDDCAVEWPPLVVGDTPFAAEEVDINQLAVIPRDDGAKQLTFYGWPLYYSNQDTFPGNTNGQGYNGVWFLISPDGEPIQR